MANQGSQPLFLGSPLIPKPLATGGEVVGKNFCFLLSSAVPRADGLWGRGVVICKMFEGGLGKRELRLDLHSLTKAQSCF